MFTRLLVALNTRDVETLRELIHPDVVGTSPQSGERSQGFDAFLREGDSYPGGQPEVDLPGSKVIVDDRWVITPSFTVVPLASPNTYTAVMKVRYPDGTDWHVVLLVELRDEKVASVETFYAPEMPAPLLAALVSPNAEAQ
jgi:hypothetical protein